MISLKNPKLTTIRHFWLYVIALEQDKYYVGITTRKDPYVRIKQHGGKLGARWTAKYKPLRPLTVVRLEKLGTMSLAEAEGREQAAFEEYRKLYGLRNVRGGRVLSTWPVYRLGSFYCNWQMVEALGIVIVLAACGLYLVR